MPISPTTAARRASQHLRIFDASDPVRLFCVRGEYRQRANPLRYITARGHHSYTYAHYTRAGAEWRVADGQTWIWTPKMHQRGPAHLQAGRQNSSCHRLGRGWFVAKLFNGDGASLPVHPNRTNSLSPPFSLPATVRVGADGEVTLESGISPPSPLTHANRLS